MYPSKGGSLSDLGYWRDRYSSGIDVLLWLGVMVRLASMSTRRPIPPAESLDLEHFIEYVKRKRSSELAV